MIRNHTIWGMEAKTVLIIQGWATHSLDSSSVYVHEYDGMKNVVLVLSEGLL